MRQEPSLQDAPVDPFLGVYGCLPLLMQTMAQAETTRGKKGWLVADIGRAHHEAALTALQTTLHMLFDHKVLQLGHSDDYAWQCVQKLMATYPARHRHTPHATAFFERWVQAPQHTRERAALLEQCRFWQVRLSTPTIHRKTSLA